MSTYKILSNNCTLGEAGTTVQADDLDGYNVDALIAGGHIEAIAAKTTKSDTETKGN
jgi:hypothetical protein